MYTFNSRLTEFCEFPSNFSDEIVKNEPMFFNSSLAYAAEHGGPITVEFLTAYVEEAHRRRLLGDKTDYANAVFDSRVHMLMKGWFPCIPGFHHDDVARGKNGQPDYDNMPYKSQHMFGLVNGEIAPTEFALGDIELPRVDDGIVYKEWHKEVDRALTEQRMQRMSAKSGIVYQFDWQTFHQGTRAVSNGWRWFGRISLETDRTRHVTNEIRRQVQVYLEYPMEGW